MYARTHACMRAYSHTRTRTRTQVWSYYSPEHPPPDPLPTGVVSQRTVSPFNNLLGAVVFTQTRAARVDCSNGGNAGLSAFTSSRDVQCAGSLPDSRNLSSSGGFGVDPTFSIASSLFDGKDMATQFYNGQNIPDTQYSAQAVYKDPEGVQSVNGGFIPYGFFPHWWNTVTRAPKNLSLIFPGDEETYKLYFDVRLQATSVQNLLTYIQDGHFLDDATQSLQVISCLIFVE